MLASLRAQTRHTGGTQTHKARHASTRPVPVWRPSQTPHPGHKSPTRKRHIRHKSLHFALPRSVCPVTQSVGKQIAASKARTCTWCLAHIPCGTMWSRDARWSELAPAAHVKATELSRRCTLNSVLPRSLCDSRLPCRPLLCCRLRVLYSLLKPRKWY
jgi:hypothetical protein